MPLAYSTEELWTDLCDHSPTGEGHVAVLRAYLDASTRDEPGLLSVAAYMFESGRVRRFIQQWRKTFGTHQDPWSWADLIARAKPFESLRRDRPQHDRLVAAGVSHVREYVIAGSIVSCWKRDVEQHAPTWIKGFGHAYAIAGHMAMAGLGQWARNNNYNGGIAYIIEAGDEGYDQLEHLLSYASKAPIVQHMYQWAGHSTQPKTSSSPFHAPDLLAWEWGKYVLETGIEEKRPMRKSLANLLVSRTQTYTFQHLGGESLMRFFNSIHDLGVEQMQEDHAALSSVEKVDVSQQVVLSGQSARVEDPE